MNANELIESVAVGASEGLSLFLLIAGIIGTCIILGIVFCFFMISLSNKEDNRSKSNYHRFGN